MNVDRDLVFSFIEEDNIQRAYFRVRPLLTIHGDVQEEAKQLWPDDGCLRIVPDRNEQHTFKDRMRTLGGWCVIDLRGIPADANKIRTNKNYRPERGESNQYILYSDTVHALPDNIFYDVIEGKAEDFAVLAQASITPRFYIRAGDTLFGPVSKATPVQPDTAGEAAGTLFTLACPDGKQRLLLCIESEQEASAQEKPQPVVTESKPAAQPEAKEDASLPIGQTLHVLDETKNFQETLQDLDQPVSKGANLLHQQPAKPAAYAAPVQQQPLTGTPLYRAPMRTSVPQPKNKLQEVVSSQWRVARNEPPAAPLPAGAKMHHVANPVEIACQSMEKAWQVPEARNQLLDFLLSLEGMQARLEPKLLESAGATSLQRVLQAKLQDMEAERLSILFQLDKAKADLESFRKSTLESAHSKAKAECDALAQEKTVHEASIKLLKDQLNALIAQRDELSARIDELQTDKLPAALAKALADLRLSLPMGGQPLRMSCVSGTHAEADEMIRRIQDVFKACGIETCRNAVVALLALLAISKRIGLTCETPSSAVTLLQNIALRMGWQKSCVVQLSAQQHPLLSAKPAEAVPALLISTLLNDNAPMEGAVKLLLSRDRGHIQQNITYEVASWPIYPLPALSYLPALDASNADSPISAASLSALCQLHGATDAEIDQVLGKVFKQVMPLSGASGKEMRQFIAICAALMDGGLAVACDWAILLWLLPMLTCTGKNAASLKPLLEEYPITQAHL